MKKIVRRLLVFISVILCVAVVVGLFLYFSSSKFQIKHKNIERAFIYHNELEREIYQFTDEELQKLSWTIMKAEIGNNSINNFKSTTGGPWFSFFCELANGRVVQIYSAGNEFLFIDSVPFEVDSTTADALLNIHKEIEEKILSLNPEILEEIMNKREE